MTCPAAVRKREAGQDLVAIASNEPQVWRRAGGGILRIAELDPEGVGNRPDVVAHLIQLQEQRIHLPLPTGGPELLASLPPCPSLAVELESRGPSRSRMCSVEFVRGRLERVNDPDWVGVVSFDLDCPAPPANRLEPSPPEPAEQGSNHRPDRGAQCADQQTLRSGSSSFMGQRPATPRATRRAPRLLRSLSRGRFCCRCVRAIRLRSGGQPSERLPGDSERSSRGAR